MLNCLFVCFLLFSALFSSPVERKPAKEVEIKKACPLMIDREINRLYMAESRWASKINQNRGRGAS